MRKLLLSALLISMLAFVGSTLAQASPVFIGESASFKAPDTRFEYFARHVAVDGDNAIVLGEHFDRSGDLITARRRAALWYQKSGNTWVYKRTLADVTTADESVSPAVALRGGVAAFIGDKLRVFEYNGTDFVASPVTGTVNGPNLEIDAGRILGNDTSACEWDGSIFTKVAGTWTVTTHLEGPYFGCNDSMPGSGVALKGNLQVLMWPYSDELERPAVEVYYDGRPFQNLGSRFGGTDPEFGPDVATDGGAAFVASSNREGIELFATGAEDWTYNGHFRPLDAYMSTATRTIRVAPEYVFQNTWSYERGAWVVNVFPYQWLKSGMEPVAVLVGRNGASLGTRFDVSGRRVLVSGNNGFTGDNTAHVFDLPAPGAIPATPATIQENFQTGNGANWTVLPGSQFAVVQDARTLRWRQSSVAGYAGAVLGGSDRTVQGVQAEVIRRSTDGTDRWLAVMTRYTDGANYYYASLRDTNRVELRKIVDGVFTLIAGAPFTVRAGQPYRLQLVSNGNLHQVFVDGRKVLQGFDSSHSHGLAGLRTYKTAADFDNVVVTGRAHTTIYRTDFSNGWIDELWNSPAATSSPWELGTVRAGQLSQRSFGALVVTYPGPETTDQVVQARIVPDAFGTPPSGQTAWFGLWSKTYYLAVQSGDRMQLLKKFSWGYQVLGTITFTTPTTQREYRLEVIGDKVRAFVDGRPMIEATDAAAATAVGGRGLATNYTQASYDDLVTYQP
ncbi:MAG TPA: hypothetical protein VMF52_15905 [Steroidobacteraceae bacterium]|nr:hypothetical protein [Steroidobacteraceae bacterium]